MGLEFKFMVESQSRSCGSILSGFRGFLSTKLRNKTKASIEQLSAQNPANLSKRQRAGFTMIEMVFVIVVTGLVATAGSKAIVQILQNYALQKEFAKIEMDSASVIRQISNYLQNSVWDSIAINSGNSYTALPSVNNHTDGTIGTTNNRTTRLYFIERKEGAVEGYYKDKDGKVTVNYDSTKGANVPFFSGFVDAGLSNGNVIVSQSETDNLSQLSTRDNVAIYFPFVNVGTDSNIVSKYYQNNRKNNTAIFPIDNFGTNYSYSYIDRTTTPAQTIRVTTTRNYMELDNTPRQIGDVAMIVNQYPTIITLEDGKNATYEKGDLIVTRNIQGTQQPATIAKKVSNFHIWTESSSSLIRLRICFEAGVVKSIMDEFCKEGIVMQ